MIKLPKNTRGTKRDNNRLASTRVLTRILICLAHQPYSTITEIRTGTGVHITKIKDGVQWLTNHNLASRTYYKRKYSRKCKYGKTYFLSKENKGVKRK